MTKIMRLTRAMFLLSVSLSLASVSAAPAAGDSGATQKVLVAGSGPNLSRNQVTVESTVRSVLWLLPKAARTHILFVDGDPQTKYVIFSDKDGEKQLRAPQIPAIDAPDLLTEFDSHRSWAALAQIAALDGLPNQLKLTGEDRRANTFQKTKIDSEKMSDVRLIRFVRLAKSVLLTYMLSLSPNSTLKSRIPALLAAEAENPLHAGIAP